MDETSPKSTSPSKTSRSIRSRRYETLAAWRVSNAPPKRSRDQPAADIKDQTSPWRQDESDSETHEQPQSPQHRRLSTESSTAVQLSRESSDSPISEIGSILDPFCALPSDIPREDQELVQFYVSYLPQILYGTRSDALFSSVRDVSLVNTLTSPFVLQWMVVNAQGLLIFLRGGQEPPSFFRRKALAYLTLKDRLEGSRGEPLPDDFIMGIIMATVAESRISPPGVSNVHLKAYEAVVAARGGLRTILLASPAGPIPSTCHFMPYVVSELPPSELVFRKDHADQAIEVLQFLARGENNVDPSKLIFSATTTTAQGPRWSSRLGSSSSLKLTLDDEDLHDPPVVSRALEQFLQPDTWDYPRYIKISSHFQALFIMVSTLWKLRRTALLQQFFLDRVHRIFVMSSAQDPSSGKYLLNLEGFSWVVVKAALEVYESFGDKSVTHGNQVDMMVDAVCALKLFMVCCGSVRRKMIAFLCKCLDDVRETPSTTGAGLR